MYVCMYALYVYTTYISRAITKGEHKEDGRGQET